MSDYRQLRCVFSLAIIASVVLVCAVANAQRPRFPDFFGNPSGNNPGGSTGLGLPVPGNQPPAITIPNFGGAVPGTVGAPPVTLQPPNFSPLNGVNGTPFNPNIVGQPQFGGITVPAPFAGTPQLGTVAPPPGVSPATIPGQAFPGFPGATNATPNYQIYPPANSQPLVGPGGQPPVLTVPNYQPPAINNTFPNAGLGQNSYGRPYGDTGLSGLQSWWNQTWSGFRDDFLPRLLERPRARQTYIYGDDDANALNINDIELATTLNWPNFVNSGQPLMISPGFIFHFWDGPNSSTGFDLPSRAYSTYLSFDHTTDMRRNVGLENNFTIGVYTDFQSTNTDSLRFTGKLLGWRRINPYLVGKFGVEYLDRIRVKLLPAFGFYATPVPDMKLDLYFPRTKLSHRIPNFNDFEIWGYVGAEYGGGSWTIEREDSSKDQVDINDVRAFTGLEWIGPRRVTGFFEVGYVFERELVYRTDPNNNFSLEDSVMVRSGLAF